MSEPQTLETVSGRSLKQAPIPLRVGVIDFSSSYAKVFRYIDTEIENAERNIRAAEASRQFVRGYAERIYEARQIIKRCEDSSVSYILENRGKRYLGFGE